MAHQQYLYLKLLLRNNLFLDLDEYALDDIPRHGLVCSFMGMRLASVFQPIFRPDGKTVGHEALLRASFLEHDDVKPEAAFADALKENRLVQFDRLVRVVHLLNHARSFPEHELLFLNVHPQLLTSVGDHGRTFEQILHYYSVPTSRVVIEIRESEVEDEARLAEAIGNYRNLGYRIAVDDFGAAHFNPERVLRLRPDIVKLDGALIAAAEQASEAADSFKRLVAKFRDAGIQVAVEGIETERQLEIARKSGTDLLQGFQLARPEFAVDARERQSRNEQQAA
ncbi:MAG: diguanylate phosphodiesterase [Gallionellales bacterium GWA2_59_43]|nr:MAG: diguanylate phosphodiesterase [Gallionellales bacterium GWA2_59_43]